jgi:hypothetical protein
MSGSTSSSAPTPSFRPIAVGGLPLGVAGKRALKRGASVRQVVAGIKKRGGFGLGKVKPSAAATGPVKVRPRRGPHPEVVSRTEALRKKKVVAFPGKTAW